MKTSLFRFLLIASVMLQVFLGKGVDARESHYYNEDIYDPYASTTGTECHFSSVSVGVGILPNGVVVTIDSPEYSVIQCIKNSSWISYFSQFGNTVNISVSNTTLGVQIVATSMNNDVSTQLKNTQWSRIITGRSPTYSVSKYTTRVVRNIPKRTTQKRVIVRQQSYSPYPRYQYTTPSRTYIAGSTLFNTYQMYRAISYQSNGVKMTFSSPDYQTMRSLQSYYFTGLFSDFSGISVSVMNISGGVEVTVTSGNSSTVEQIQKIGYALVYN